MCSATRGCPVGALRPSRPGRLDVRLPSPAHAWERSHSGRRGPTVAAVVASWSSRAPGVVCHALCRQGSSRAVGARHGRNRHSADVFRRPQKGSAGWGSPWDRHSTCRRRWRPWSAAPPEAAAACDSSRSRTTLRSTKCRLGVHSGSIWGPSGEDPGAIQNRSWVDPGGRFGIEVSNSTQPTEGLIRVRFGVRLRCSRGASAVDPGSIQDLVSSGAQSRPPPFLGPQPPLQGQRSRGHRGRRVLAPHEQHEARAHGAADPHPRAGGAADALGLKRRVVATSAAAGVALRRSAGVRTGAAERACVCSFVCVFLCLCLCLYLCLCVETFLCAPCRAHGGSATVSQGRRERGR